MKDLLNQVYTTEYPTSTTKSGERVAQTPAAQLKADLQSKVEEVLVDTMQVDAYQSDKGFVLALPNEVLGEIYVEVQVVVKSLDLDVVTMHEEVVAKREAKEATRLAKQALMEEKAKR